MTDDAPPFDWSAAEGDTPPGGQPDNPSNGPPPDTESGLTAEEEEERRRQLADAEEQRELARQRKSERNRRRVRKEIDAEEFAALRAARKLRLLDGWEFLAEDADGDEQVWGAPGGGVVWAPGEPLMLFGGNGVFKSTLSHLLVFARLGLLGPDGRPRADHRRVGPDDHPDDWGAVLGMPVRPMDLAGLVLYLAGDRPRQIRRAMRRHRRDWMADVLRDHLLVHDGPLPFDLTTEKDALADMAQAQPHKCSDVFVDSVKDYCPKPSDDESANGYNRARQECVARGMQWVEDHHNRKIQQGQQRTNGIDDVYGSRWLTAGAGSVVSMWVDEEGSTLVHVRQVKSPGEFIAEQEVTVDKTEGTMGASVHLNPIAWIKGAGAGGITAGDYARYVGLSVNAARNQLNTRMKQGVLEMAPDRADNLKRWRVVLGMQPPQPHGGRQEDGLGGTLF